MENLEWPYEDNCKRYFGSNSIDRLDAIVNCVNFKSFLENSMLSNIKVFKRGDIFYGKYRVNVSGNEEYTEECERKYKQLDCSSTVYLTEATTPKYIYRYPLPARNFFYTGGDSDPSFMIRSKPRIDNIDYVTYILGALGAWIGFSFVAINPIPFFLRIDLFETDSNIVSLANMNFKMDQMKKVIDTQADSIRQSHVVKQQILMALRRVERENEAANDKTKRTVSQILQEFAEFRNSS